MQHSIEKKQQPGTWRENRIMYQRFLQYSQIPTHSHPNNFPKSIDLPIYLIFHQFNHNTFD